MKLYFRIIFKTFFIFVILAGCATTVEIKETDSDALLNQGAALLEEDNYDLSIDYFSKAIETNPNLANAYYNRATAYYAIGLINKAITDYTKAIVINPWHEFAYNNRGVAYYEIGQFDKAISDYTKALEINPKYVNAYSNRGNAYVAMKQSLLPPALREWPIISFLRSDLIIKGLITTIH